MTTWLPKQIPPQVGVNHIELRDISQFRYPGKAEIIVSNFIQDGNAARGAYSIRRQQYWVKEANQWHIAYEDAIQIAGAKVVFDGVKESRKDPINEATKDLQKAVAVAAADKEPARPATDNRDKNKQSQAEILKTVDHWVNAWSSKNTNAYLAHYARDFQTPKGETHKSWMEERRARIDSKGKIKLKLEAPSVHLDGNSATVKFRQHYQSGALVTNSRKVLVLVKQEVKWLIKQERTGS